MPRSPSQGGVRGDGEASPNYSVALKTLLPEWQPLTRAAWLLLAVYTALALAYNFAQPPFEPSDEQYQFGYIRYLVEHGQLPIARAGELTGYHHPPLYFALAALLAAPFPAADLPEYETRINPYARYRHWEPSLDNKNLYIHGPWDGWPFHDTALAVHVTRLISLLCGLLTVALTYQLAHSLWGEDAALTAAGLLAFTPMFTSLSGALQNDMGATALGAVLLWLGVDYAHTGLTVRRAALLGAVGGAAMLMKLTAAFLLPPLALLIGWMGWRAGGGRQALTWLAAFSVSAAVVSGWWFARNLALYGDPTAVNINLENFGGQTSWWEGVRLWPEMVPYAWTTFWGRIGHGGIVLYDGMYQVLAGLALLAAVGFFYPRHPKPALVGFTFLVLAAIFCFLGLMLYLTLSPTGANGRYAYPALPAYMSLLAAGLLNLVPEKLRRATAYALCGGMFVFSASVLIFFVAPAYAPPPTMAQLPATATPLNANLGGTARIHGYQLSTSEARPGERVTVTIYWEPLSLTDRPYSVYLHLLAGDMLIAQRDTYPGLGRAPTTAWPVGQLFADEYLVIIPEDAPAVTAEWKVGLWQAETGDYAFALEANGEPVDSGVRFGSFQITNPAPSP